MAAKKIAPKKTKKKSAPRGKMSLTPYLCVKGAAAAIAFYKKAFGATEKFRLSEPDGRIGHAELAIGDGAIMLCDESPAFGALSPPAIGGTPVTLHLYVPDVDATMKKAAKLGATIIRPAEDQFYGDRAGMIADPFGHKWHVGTRKTVVSPKAMQKRLRDLMKG